MIVAALILSLKTVSQSYQGVWLSNRDAKLSDKRFALLSNKISATHTVTLTIISLDKAAQLMLSSLMQD